MTAIPLVVCVKNEAATLGACLESLRRAVRSAEARLPLTFQWLVVLDDCTDGSERIARREGVPVARSSGGKIEAQRVGSQIEPTAPFRVYSDGDIVVAPDTLDAVCRRLLDDPVAQIASPPRQPVAPIRRTLLAGALHDYNRARGFAPPPAWFSGKLFAVRHWAIPTVAELAPRIAALPADPFYRYQRGLIADDIYLSRITVATHGPSAIAHTIDGMVHFAAPETFAGMYRYYRRMRRELERVDRLVSRDTRDARALRRAPRRSSASDARRAAALRRFSGRAAGVSSWSIAPSVCISTLHRRRRR